jgi:hypothetical protein
MYKVKKGTKTISHSLCLPQKSCRVSRITSLKKQFDEVGRFEFHFFVITFVFIMLWIDDCIKYYDNNRV